MIDKLKTRVIFAFSVLVAVILLVEMCRREGTGCWAAGGLMTMRGAWGRTRRAPGRTPVAEYLLSPNTMGDSSTTEFATNGRVAKLNDLEGQNVRINKDKTAVN